MGGAGRTAEPAGLLGVFPGAARLGGQSPSVPADQQANTHRMRPGPGARPNPAPALPCSPQPASQVSSLSGSVAQVRPRKRNEDLKYLSKCLCAGGIRVGRAAEPTRWPTVSGRPAG